MPLEQPAAQPATDQTGKRGMELDYVDIFDFSPGIYSDYVSVAAGSESAFVAANAKQDARAAEFDTYGCYADTNGYLRPLPQGGSFQGIANLNFAPPAGLTQPSATFDFRFFYLLDAIVFGPYRSSNIAPMNDRSSTDIVFVLDAFFSDRLGGTAFFYYVVGRRFLMDLLSEIDVAYHRNTTVMTGGATGLILGSGMLMKSRSVNDVQVFPWNGFNLIPYVGMLVTGTGSIFQESIAAPVGNETGYSTAVADLGIATFMGGGGSGWQTFWNFPDLNTPAVNSVQRTNWLGQYAQITIGHQGRALTIGTYPHGFGADIGPITVISAEEMIFYTDVQQVNITTPVGGGNLAVAEENPSMYGAAGSMAANELFLVKHSSGAVLIRGDLDNPNVLRLPFVEPTGGVISAGVNTPIGFVYLSRNGVFAWNGGLRSEKLSKQIDAYDHFDCFINSANVQEAKAEGSRGRFAYWDPFIACPKNWLYNIETDSWWRLENPNDITGAFYGSGAQTARYPYSCYDVSPQKGTLYAFPYKLSTTSGTVGRAWKYNWGNFRSGYKWRSQPIIRSYQQYMEIQEVHLAYMKSSTATQNIVVTISGYDENGVLTSTQSVTFATGVAAAVGIPLYQVKNIVNVQKCRSFAITIAVGIGGDALTASTIMGVRVGYRMGQGVVKV